MNIYTYANATPSLSLSLVLRPCQPQALIASDIQSYQRQVNSVDRLDEISGILILGSKSSMLSLNRRRREQGRVLYGQESSR